LHVCTVTLLALAVTTVAAAPTAQKGTQGAELQKALRTGLRAPRWTERFRAVERLQHIPTAQLRPQTKTAILDLYADEIKKWSEITQGSYSEADLHERRGEGYAEYFGGLGELVMRIGGERALSLLIASPSQPLADSNREIAAYGAQALPMVLGRLQQLRTLVIDTPNYHGPDYEDQMAMADILTDMIQLDQQEKLKHALTPSDYDNIRQMLRPLLASNDDYVRLYAALGLIRAGDRTEASAVRSVFLRFLDSPIPGRRSEGLTRIASSVDDARFVPLAKVKELAASDPYHYRQGVLGNGPVVYPVRDAARKVLKKFAAPSGPTAAKKPNADFRF
jgi:hypothetical protein